MFHMKHQGENHVHSRNNICFDLPGSISCNLQRFNLQQPARADGLALEYRQSGGWIYAKSADNPDSLRGSGLDLVIFDECAYIKEDAWSQVIRPALADKSGDAIFIGTPAGRNWFWRLYQRALAESEWHCWHFPSSENPYLLSSELEQAQLEMPDRDFRQEFGAEFIEHEGAVFRKIRQALHTPNGKAHKNHHIVAGVDWGKEQDFTAVSILCAQCNSEIAHDRFNKVDYIVQRDRIRALHDRYKVADILAERNAAEANIEMLQADGLPVRSFQTTASSKPLLVRNLATALEKEEIKLIDDPIWTAELEAFEQKVNPNTGRSTYAAPEGLHDDTVIARCLAWQAATSGGGYDLV